MPPNLQVRKWGPGGGRRLPAGLALGKSPHSLGGALWSPAGPGEPGLRIGGSPGGPPKFGGGRWKLTFGDTELTLQLLREITLEGEELP